MKKTKLIKFQKTIKKNWEKIFSHKFPVEIPLKDSDPPIFPLAPNPSIVLMKDGRGKERTGIEKGAFMLEETIKKEIFWRELTLGKYRWEIYGEEFL